MIKPINMAGLWILLVPLLCCRCAFAKETPDIDAAMDISLRKAFENLSDRVDQFEEMLVARDRKIEELEEKLEARDQKINQLEERLTEHDHYIDLLKTNVDSHNNIHTEGGSSEYIRTGMNNIQKDNDKQRVDAMNESATPEESVDNNVVPTATTDTSVSANRPLPPQVPLSGERSRMGRTPDNKRNNLYRRADTEPEVAFFSTLSTTTEHIGTNQPIVFDHVVTNIGNAYNRYLGSFTAPVSGTYVFSTTLATEGSHLSWYGIFKNASHMTTMRLNGVNNAYDSVGQTVILQLSEGDVVTVKHTSTDHALHGANYCLFSGFLLPSGSASLPVNIVGK